MEQGREKTRLGKWMMRGFVCLLLTAACLLRTAVTSRAATPRVMLADYQVEEGQVVSGKEFTLKLEIKNYSAKQVKNLKVALSSENGEFIPAKGAGNAYIEAVEAGETEQVSFRLKAEDGLEERSYRLHVVTDYENPGGWEYQSEDTVFLSVELPQRLSLTDLFIDGEAPVVGDTVEISAQINNMGEGALYNVIAKVEGDNIAETDSFVGTIGKGQSGRLDLLTKADIVTEGDHKKNRILITYENRAGEEFSTEVPFTVSVGVPVYKNLEKVKESGDTGTDWNRAAVAVLAVLAAFAAAYALYRRRKRKQRILDEFMD